MDLVRVDFLSNLVKHVFESSRVDLKSEFFLIESCLEFVELFLSEYKIFLHLSDARLDFLRMGGWLG